MSVPSEVDGTAPVLAYHEIDIDAPLDAVWRLRTDVDAWTDRQADMTSAHLDGAFRAGNSFDRSSHGFPVTSTICDVIDHWLGPLKAVAESRG